MFTLLESKKAIAEAQRTLEATIRRDLSKTAVRDIGYSGGTTANARVNTDLRYWYWSKDHRRKGETNRWRKGLVGYSVYLSAAKGINNSIQFL